MKDSFRTWQFLTWKNIHLVLREYGHAATFVDVKRRVGGGVFADWAGRRGHFVVQFVNFLVRSCFKWAFWDEYILITFLKDLLHFNW